MMTMKETCVLPVGLSWTQPESSERPTITIEEQRLIQDVAAASVCSPTSACRALLQNGGDLEKALEFLRQAPLDHQDQAAVQQLSQTAVCSAADALRALLQTRGDSTCALTVLLELKKAALLPHEAAVVSQIAQCTSATFDQALVALLQSDGNPQAALATLDRQRQELATSRLPLRPEKPVGKQIFWPQPNDVSPEAIAYRQAETEWEQQRHEALERRYADPYPFCHTEEERLRAEMVSVGLMPPQIGFDNQSRCLSVNQMKAMLAANQKALQAVVKDTFTGDHLPTIGFDAAGNMLPGSQQGVEWLADRLSQAPKVA